jgi:hypothetical protein
MSGAKAFGVQSPTLGEDAVSWQTWSDGAGNVPTITGDADWGKLKIDLSGEEGRSAVYDHGSAVSRTYTLTENRYGSGTEDAVLEIRGSTTSFIQDAAVPAWEEYIAPITRVWRYVQIRETTLSTFDQSSGAVEVEV